MFSRCLAYVWTAKTMLIRGTVYALSLGSHNSTKVMCFGEYETLYSYGTKKARDFGSGKQRCVEGLSDGNREEDAWPSGNCKKAALVHAVIRIRKRYALP